MAAACRVGDNTSGMCNVGALCCPHTRTGTCNTGSPNVFINSAAAHRAGDGGPCNCPHGGSFASGGGSGTVFINKKAASRVGDATSCTTCGQPGSHTGGSLDVFIG